MPDIISDYDKVNGNSALSYAIVRRFVWLVVQRFTAVPPEPSFEGSIRFSMSNKAFSV